MPTETQIPAPRVDFIDQRTGKISREWYLWLLNRIGGADPVGTVTSIATSQPAAGLVVTGGPITSTGTIRFALADDLLALESLSATGIAVRTASNTWAQRTIAGTSNQVIVTNGDGVSGNPTLATPQDIATTSSPTFVNLTLTGDIAINGGDATSTAATFNLLNSGVTTLNIGGAATAINIGNSSGDTTLLGRLTMPLSYVTSPTTAKVLLPLDGANGATTTTDVYGNTVAAFNASGTLSTTFAKFGASSFKQVTGNDYIIVSGPTALGTAGGSWTMECWVYWPEVASDFVHPLFSALNAANFGVVLEQTSTGSSAPNKLRLLLSSNGTTWNIANAVDVANTPVAGQWNHYALTFDQAAGKYYSYCNGVKVHEVTSALTINAITALYVSGKHTGATVYTRTSYLDEFRLSNSCRYPSGTTFTPSTVAFVAENSLALNITAASANYFASEIMVGTTTQTGVAGNGTFANNVAVNGGNFTTTATTFNILNGTATTVNAFGAATAINVGTDLGVTTLQGMLTLPHNSVTSAAQALLHFDGANGATTTTDVYGNTVTLAGGVALSTSLAKFGASSVLISDSSGYYADVTGPTTFGAAGWTLDCWVQWPDVSGNRFLTVFFPCNASQYGAALQYTTVGSGVGEKLRLYLSSNGSSWNIASAVDVTIDLSANIWYHIALTFDSAAGHYYSYVNGVKVHDTTSALTVCNIERIRLGRAPNNTSGLAGYMDEFRFSNSCLYPNGTTFTPPTAAATGPTASNAINQTGTAPNLLTGITTIVAAPILTALTGLVQGKGSTAASAITDSTTVGQVLRVTGSATYAWGALDLDDTDAVTGTLGVANGGTDIASYAVGDILYASGATTLAKLADIATGNALISGGVGVAPAWGKIGLTTHVSGTLPVANGGTGAVTLTGVLVGTGTTAVSVIANSSTVGQILRVTGAATYAWGALDLDDADAITGSLGVANGGTNLTAIADASLLVTNAANTLSVLTAGASQSVRRNSGNTAWEAFTPTSGTVTSVAQTVTAATAPTENLAVSGSPVTSAGTLALSISPWWMQKDAIASGETLTIAAGYTAPFYGECINSGSIVNSGQHWIG